MTIISSIGTGITKTETPINAFSATSTGLEIGENGNLVAVFTQEMMNPSPQFPAPYPTLLIEMDFGLTQTLPVVITSPKVLTSVRELNFTGNFTIW
jgi:hypothetical protein